MTTKSKRAPQFDAIVAAPFGAVGISAQGVQVAITLVGKKQPPKIAENKSLQRVVPQIEAYLTNPYHDFNLPLVYRGTAFQRRVWQLISAIPCGQTMTYGQIAAQLESSPRAVANACGANPLPLVVPCHRVVAKSGLGGFMRGDPDGPKIKQWLLHHEGVKI